MNLSVIRAFSDEKGKEYKLVYTVIENEFPFEEGSVHGYGIRIEKYDGAKLKESDEFENITSKSIEIERLFMLLSMHTVTPVALRDVLEDYLA